MNYKEFKDYIENRVSYETIYEDGEGRTILVIRMLDMYAAMIQHKWVGLTQTQVKLLRDGVEKESIKTGDSIDWVFYTHINEALKDINQ